MAFDIVIRNEADAWEWLQRALDNDPILEQPFDISFNGWPVLDLRYEGRDFNSSVPTRIMPALLDTQREINRLYARLKYGSQDTRKLTQEERERLELVVRVSQGSSFFDTNLSQKLEETWRAAVDKMDSKHILIAILGVGMLWTSGTAWKAWLAHQAEMKGLEHEQTMTELENERIETLARAGAQNDALSELSEGVDDVRNESLRHLKPQDSLQFPSSQHRVTGEMASQLTSRPREQSIETRFDGEFVIQSVASGETRGFKIKVKRVTDGKEITVVIPDGTLNYDQREILKNNEWTKRPVLMAINAKVLRGEVSSATLISVQNLGGGDEQA